MSLSPEEFARTSDACDELQRRLIKLFGFNQPAITDHYNCTSLYNKRIFVQTTDEEILAIHERFLAWRESLQAIFVENGVTLKRRDFKKLFRSCRMDGTMYFLGIEFDIDGDMEIYRAAIVEYIEKKGLKNQ